MGYLYFIRHRKCQHLMKSGIHWALDFIRSGNIYNQMYATEPYPTAAFCQQFIICRCSYNTGKCIICQLVCFSYHYWTQIFILGCLVWIIVFFLLIIHIFNVRSQILWMGYILLARFRCFISDLNYVDSQQTQSARNNDYLCCSARSCWHILNTYSLKKTQVNNTNFTFFLKDDVIKDV